MDKTLLIGGKDPCDALEGIQKHSDGVTISLQATVVQVVKAEGKQSFEKL